MKQRPRWPPSSHPCYRFPSLFRNTFKAPSPAPDLIPAETSTENLHRDWNYERGHIRDTLTACAHTSQSMPKIVMSMDLISADAEDANTKSIASKTVIFII